MLIMACTYALFDLDFFGNGFYGCGYGWFTASVGFVRVCAVK